MEVIKTKTPFLKNYLKALLSRMVKIKKKDKEQGDLFEILFREIKLRINLFIIKNMVEPLLSGIVLGLVPVTIAGVFVTAYLQYRRGDLANF